MQIEGLIPFKYSTNQAMASLYFLRTPINFCFFLYCQVSCYDYIRDGGYNLNKNWVAHTLNWNS